MVGISWQRYYRSFLITESKRAKADQVIKPVNSLRVMMPRLGTRKLYHILELSLQPLHVDRDQLFSILKANNMLIKPKRNYRITTNSHHRFRKYKNLIEDVRLEQPEQVWVSDITYLGGRDRNCYLVLVTDTYSKKIIGYDVFNSKATERSLKALNMDIKQRTYKESLIHHSDKGLQYGLSENIEKEKN